MPPTIRDRVAAGLGARYQIVTPATLYPRVAVTHFSCVPSTSLAPLAVRSTGPRSVRAIARVRPT